MWSLWHSTDPALAFYRPCSSRIYQTFQGRPKITSSRRVYQNVILDDPCKTLHPQLLPVFFCLFVLVATCPHVPLFYQLPWILSEAFFCGFSMIPPFGTVVLMCRLLVLSLMLQSGVALYASERSRHPVFSGYSDVHLHVYKEDSPSQNLAPTYIKPYLKT